ncbi:MAG TPA: MFS transporter, partial [Burkholderiales bacterium]|nr:MFS transporter [Burkholderiales bacterium]
MTEARPRWIVVGLGVAAFWIAFFHRVAPGTIATELQTAFAVSGAALGALAATYFYVYAVMQVPTGVLVDTLGPRKVLTAGGVIAGIGSVMFGLADNVAAAAAGRTLAGLGVSVAFVAALKLNAAWFEERHFATTASLTNVVGLTGALTATVPLAWAVTSVSWRHVFVAIGIASFVTAILTWWLMRDRPVTPLHGATVITAADAGTRWYHGLGEVMRNCGTWTGFWISFG